MRSSPHATSPARDLAELTAVLVIPALAALLRAHRGFRQLERVGEGATLGRQLLLGCAITALLLFEGLAGALHCARDAPPSAWLTAAILYLFYLGLVVPALGPGSRVQGVDTA